MKELCSVVYVSVQSCNPSKHISNLALRIEWYPPTATYQKEIAQLCGINEHQ